MIDLVEYLNVPVAVALIVIAIFFVIQFIGEILEFKGKAVPEFIKIRKYFSRKKQEKQETIKTLQEVKQLLNDVNSHYSVDNIAKRNSWMKWVNDRAEVYDNSIVEIGKKLSALADVLDENTKTTEELFIENSRDRIIDFAAKTVDENVMLSREEFNRIFKVYKKYETFLERHNLTNGEVDIAHRIINESYEKYMKKHLFLEDVRGYE